MQRSTNTGTDTGTGTSIGTGTLSITEALAEHRSRSQQNDNNDQSRKRRRCHPSLNTSRHPQCPIDVAVVTLSRAQQVLDYYSRASTINSNIIILTVGDHSLRCNECARIFIKANNGVNNYIYKELLELEKGDVIRLNGVFVKRDYGVDLFRDNKQEKEEGQRRIQRDDETNNPMGQEREKERSRQKLTTIVGDFGIRNDESTTFFCRISKTLHSGHYNHHVNVNVDANCINNNNNNAMNMMMTSQHVVGNILKWFHGQHLFHHHNHNPDLDPASNVSLGGFNGHGHGHDYDAYYNHESISMYKRRRIRELNVSNILSDVVVKVKRLQEATERTKSTLAVNGRRGNNSTLLHAILSENANTNTTLCSRSISFSSNSENSIGGEENFIPFVYDCRNKHIHSHLQRASQHQQPVLLTKVLTQPKISSSGAPYFYHRNLLGNESNFILIPTAETSIEIAPCGDEKEKETNHVRDDNDSSQLHLYTPSNENQNMRTCRNSCMLSSSSFSHSQSPKSNDSKQLTTILRNRSVDQSSSSTTSSPLVLSPYTEKLEWMNSESKFVLRANIASIHFKDLGMTLGTSACFKKKWPNAKDLLHLLIDNEVEGKSQPQQSTKTQMKFRSSILTLEYSRNGQIETCRVNADHNIMTTLCGSRDPASLVDNGSNYLLLVSDLLRGILCLQIIMEWTLVGRNNEMEVESVDLTSLDF